MKPRWVTLMENGINDYKDEIWIVYADFTDHQISNYGRIKDLRNNKIRRKSKAIKKNTYKTVTLQKYGESYTFKLHQLVLMAFIGEKPDGYEACHNNGNSLDNRLENLRWDTHKGNIGDRVKQERQKHIITKDNKYGLHEQDIAAIRNHPWSKGIIKELSELYWIPYDVAYDIYYRRTWVNTP